MRGMPSGQYVAGCSVLHRLDARAKIICLFLLLASIVAALTLPGAALLLGVTAAIFGLSGLPPRTVFNSLARLWPFFLVIFLMNALFFDGENTLWEWWILKISTAGMAQGASVALRVALLVTLSQVLTCTTAPMEITNALESLMKPLKLLRIPVEDIAMIISVAIQFVPTLIEEAEMIRKAQIARGARFESKKLLEKAESVAPLVIPVFLAAFRRADELSVAMEARGYRGARNRTKKAKERMNPADTAAMLLCAAVWAARLRLL